MQGNQSAYKFFGCGAKYFTALLLTKMPTIKRLASLMLLVWFILLFQNLLPIGSFVLWLKYRRNVPLPCNET